MKFLFSIITLLFVVFLNMQSFYNENVLCEENINQAKLSTYSVVKYEQLVLASSCGFDGEIRITSESVIDSIVEDNITINRPVNDTAILTIDAGEHDLYIYFSDTIINDVITVEKLEPWDFEVIETHEPRCFNSADGWIRISYPLNISGIAVDGLNVLLQDSILNLTSGDHQVQLTDDRNCLVTKTVHIPEALNSCIEWSECFSPNGDGINEYWQPKVPVGSVVLMNIYSYRNLSQQAVVKELIYEGNDVWDGTNSLKNRIANSGYYLVSLTIDYPAYLNKQAENKLIVIKLIR